MLSAALALARNYDPLKAPTHFKITDLLVKFSTTFGTDRLRRRGAAKGGFQFEDVERRQGGRWCLFIVAGMWFQDLFNYDFRRTEQCIIPYATQEGEISFCAYNTGIGWRKIIEKMHLTATLTKWYEDHGRHEIIAGDKSVKLDSTDSLELRDEIVTREEQHDLDKLGIARNAREERLRAREENRKQAEQNERMAKLYRKVVLKEPEQPELVQIQKS